jgi:hypothetical protein
MRSEGGGLLEVVEGVPIQNDFVENQYWKTKNELRKLQENQEG